MIIISTKIFDGIFKNILKIGFWQSFATLILDCGLTLPNYFLTKNLFGQLKTFPHNFDPTIFITIGFVHIVISLVIPFLEQEQYLFGHESFWQNFFHKIFVEQKFFSTENNLNQIFINQTINLMGFDTIGINLVD